MTTTIAVTISCPPRPGQPQYQNSYQAYFFDDRVRIRTFFKQGRVKSYIFYPELDQKGRLHYHGAVRVDNNERIRFYKHTRAKLARLGFIDTKEMGTFKDILKWSLYMRKDWGLTQHIISYDQPIMPSSDKTQIVSGKLVNIIDITHYMNDPQLSLYQKMAIL